MLVWVVKTCEKYLFFRIFAIGRVGVNPGISQWYRVGRRGRLAGRAL